MGEGKNQTAQGWAIGTTQDTRTGRLGVVARRRDDPRGLDAIRVNWMEAGDPREIAARLRELASALEMEAADDDDHTFEGPSDGR